MNSMKAKAFLLQIQKLNTLIENKTAERAQLYAMATSTTAPTALDTGVRVQTSGNPQRMTAAIDSYIELDKQIAENIARIESEKQRIISVIEQLDAKEYDMLHKMYVGTVKDGRLHYMDYVELGELYNKSYSWCTTMHGLALKKVQRIIDGMSEM